MSRDSKKDSKDSKITSEAVQGQITDIKKYTQEQGLLGQSGHNNHKKYRIAQAAMSLSYADDEFTDSDKNILFQAIATTFDDNRGGLGRSELRRILLRGQARQAEPLNNVVPSEYKELGASIESVLSGKLDPTYRTLLRILLATLKSKLPVEKIPIAIDQWVSTYFLFKNNSDLHVSKDTKSIKERVLRFKGSHDDNSGLENFVISVVDHKSQRYKKNKKKWINDILALQKKLSKIEKEFTESKTKIRESKEQKEAKIGQFSAALNLLEPKILNDLKEQNNRLASFFVVDKQSPQNQKKMEEEDKKCEFQQSLVAGLKSGELDQQLKDIEEEIEKIKDLTGKSLALEKKGEFLLKKYQSLEKYAVQAPDFTSSELRTEKLERIKIATNEVRKLMKRNPDSFKSDTLQNMVGKLEVDYKSFEELSLHYDSILDKVATIDSGLKEIKRIRASITEVKSSNAKNLTALNSLSECIKLDQEEEEEYLNKLYDFKDETKASEIEEEVEVEIEQTKKLVADIEKLEKRGQELIRYLDKLDEKVKKLQEDQDYLSSPTRDKAIEEVRASNLKIRTEILTFKPGRPEDDLSGHVEAISRLYDKGQQQINENNKKLLREEHTDAEHYTFLSHKKTILSAVSKIHGTVSGLFNSIASSLSSSFLGSFISSPTEVKSAHKKIEEDYSGRFKKLNLDKKYPPEKNDISESLKVKINLSEIEGLADTDPLKLVLSKHEFSTFSRHFSKASEANEYKAVSCYSVRQAMKYLHAVGEKPNSEAIKIVIENIELILDQMEVNATAIKENSKNFKQLIKDFRNELSNEKAEIFRKLGIEALSILNTTKVEYEEAFEISAIVSSFPRKREFKIIEVTSAWLMPIYSQKLNLNPGEFKLRGPLAIVVCNSTESKDLASFYTNHAKYVLECVFAEMDELSENITNAISSGSDNLKGLDELELLSGRIDNFLVLNRNLEMLCNHILQKKNEFFKADDFLKEHEKTILYYKNLSKSAENFKKHIEEFQSSVKKSETEMVNSQRKILSMNPARADDIVESIKKENYKLAEKLKDTKPIPELTTKFDKRIEDEALVTTPPESVPDSPRTNTTEVSSIRSISETKDPGSTPSTPQSESKIRLDEPLTHEDIKKLRNIDPSNRGISGKDNSENDSKLDEGVEEFVEQESSKKLEVEVKKEKTIEETNLEDDKAFSELETKDEKDRPTSRNPVYFKQAHDGIRSILQALCPNSTDSLFKLLFPDLKEGQSIGQKRVTGGVKSVQFPETLEMVARKAKDPKYHFIISPEAVKYTRGELIEIEKTIAASEELQTEQMKQLHQYIALGDLWDKLHTILPELAFKKIRTEGTKFLNELSIEALSWLISSMPDSFTTEREQKDYKTLLSYKASLTAKSRMDKVDQVGDAVSKALDQYILSFDIADLTKLLKARSLDLFMVKKDDVSKFLGGIVTLSSDGNYNFKSQSLLPWVNSALKAKGDIPLAKFADYLKSELKAINLLNEERSCLQLSKEEVGVKDKMAEPFVNLLFESHKAKIDYLTALKQALSFTKEDVNEFNEEEIKEIYAALRACHLDALFTDPKTGCYLTFSLDRIMANVNRGLASCYNLERKSFLTRHPVKKFLESKMSNFIQIERYNDKYEFAGKPPTFIVAENNSHYSFSQKIKTEDKEIKKENSTDKDKPSSTSRGPRPVGVISSLFEVAKNFFMPESKEQIQQKEQKLEETLSEENQAKEFVKYIQEQAEHMNIQIKWTEGQMQDVLSLFRHFRDLVMDQQAAFDKVEAHLTNAEKYAEEAEQDLLSAEKAQKLYEGILGFFGIHEASILEKGIEAVKNHVKDAVTGEIVERGESTLVGTGMFSRPLARLLNIVDRIPLPTIFLGK